MIKKITLIILLLCAVISCGIKNNPEYKDPEKKASTYKIYISNV